MKIFQIPYFASRPKDPNIKDDKPQWVAFVLDNPSGVENKITVHWYEWPDGSKIIKTQEITLAPEQGHLILPTDHPNIKSWRYKMKILGPDEMLVDQYGSPHFTIARVVGT